MHSMQQLKNISPKQLAPGLTGYYAHGKNMTLGLVEIIAGNNLPQHQHPHEQITYILEGQLDMTIDDTLCSLTAGMYYVIPSNVWHGAVAVTDCKVIDVFNPVREDYKAP
jgi:quercetin dioxygenase-like cupin family protein